MSHFQSHSKLYYLIDNLITQYAGQYIEPHEAISNILKYAEKENVDKYLSFRPFGFDEEYKKLLDEEKPLDNFIEKTISKSDEKIILAYVPYLNEENANQFVNTFLRSPLASLNKSLNIPLIHKLIKKAKLEDYAQKMALLLAPHWLDSVLQNPTNTIINDLDKRNESYFKVILKYYLGEERKYKTPLETFYFLINHPDMNIDSLLKLETSFTKAAKQLNIEESDEKVLLPLRKHIIEKEKEQLIDSLANSFIELKNSTIKKVKI